MSLLKIARMGHPVLRAPAAAIADPTAPEIGRLIDDMIETLADVGGVGLAAPQVHAPVRLLIYRVPAERLGSMLGEGPRPLAVLINPRLDLLGEADELGWEGCLSVPGLRGAVPRHGAVRWSGQGRDGAPLSGEAIGFHARVLQHEYDHLDGRLYPSRMTDLGLLGFVEETLRYPIPLDGVDDAAEEA